MNVIIPFLWSTALNEALREEVQRLKIAAGHQAVNGSPFNRGLPHQYSSHQQSLHHFGSPQTQTQEQQQQLYMTQSSTNNQQTLNGQPRPSFLDFNKRG